MIPRDELAPDDAAREARTVLTVRNGMLPAAALVTAFTALLTIDTHARHVQEGYAFERAVRETERRERQIDRLRVQRAALTSPAAIQSAAARFGVALERPSGRGPTSIDLEAHVRARVPPVEAAKWARKVR